MQDRESAYYEWIREHVSPNANAWEADQKLPAGVIQNMADAGCFGATITEGYGGLNLDSLTLGRMAARTAKGSVSLLSVFVVHAMVAQALDRFGDENQKKAFLPKMASGEITTAFALTEPDFGSEATGICCAAKRTDSGICLNGRKKWISGACYADWLLVFVRLEEEGLAALLVPASAPGLTITPMKDLLGFRAAGIAELEFRDCLVPCALPLEGSPGPLVGPPGGGFSFVASHALHTGRFIVGWGGVGIMEACLEASVAYASERRQFGVPLRKHQLIQGMVADMATELAAAAALGEKAAASRESMGPDSVMDTAMFKYFSSRAAFQAAANALQLHGGNGCSPQYPLQRYFRDAKICEIIEGSSQMQQIMISSAAFSRGRSRRRKTDASDN